MTYSEPNSSNSPAIDGARKKRFTTLQNADGPRAVWGRLPCSRKGRCLTTALWYSIYR